MSSDRVLGRAHRYRHVAVLVLGVVAISAAVALAPNPWALPLALVGLAMPRSLRALLAAPSLRASDSGLHLCLPTRVFIHWNDLQAVRVRGKTLELYAANRVVEVAPGLLRPGPVALKSAILAASPTSCAYEQLRQSLRRAILDAADALTYGSRTVEPTVRRPSRAR